MVCLGGSAQTMPLSDHEQRILEEIERQLYEQDPKFARNVASRSRKGGSSHNLRRGIGLFILGFIGLFGFFVSTSVLLGVVSFLLMVGGATLAYNGAKRAGEERAQHRGGSDIDNSLAKRVKDLSGRVRKLRRRDAD